MSPLRSCGGSSAKYTLSVCLTETWLRDTDTLSYCHIANHSLSLVYAPYCTPVVHTSCMSWYTLTKRPHTKTDKCFNIQRVMHLIHFWCVLSLLCVRSSCLWGAGSACASERCSGRGEQWSLSLSDGTRACQTSAHTWATHTNVNLPRVKWKFSRYIHTQVKPLKYFS